MVWGEYDAKKAGQTGFVAGGASLHRCGRDPPARPDPPR